MRKFIGNFENIFPPKRKRKKKKTFKIYIKQKMHWEIRKWGEGLFELGNTERPTSKAKAKRGRI